MSLGSFIFLCLLGWASKERSSALKQEWRNSMNDLWQSQTSAKLQLYNTVLKTPSLFSESLIGGKENKRKEDEAKPNPKKNIKKEKEDEISAQEDFEAQQKLWEKHSRAMINVAHTAVEISDIVPSVSKGLRRVAAINGLVSLVSDVLDDVDGLDTRTIRPPLKKDAIQMEKLRLEMRDLMDLLPKVSDTISKMANWLAHATSLTDHILSKMDRFADFEDVWHHKIAPWYIAKGGEDAEEVKQVGELALKECAEILRLVNDHVVKIQGMMDFLNGYKAYIQIGQAVAVVENKLSQFLHLLRTKSVSVVLPAENCLEKRMDEVNEINSLLDILGGVKDSSRRQLSSWSWDDLDFSSIDTSDSDEDEISKRDTTDSERDPELRKLMKRFKRKTAQKMEFEGVQGEDCLKPRMASHTLMDLLAMAESLQKFGAYNVLRAVFIPMFKQAGIWGGADAPLIKLSRAIVKNREDAIKRFDSPTYANVLSNVELVAGKVCGVMALGTERVHDFSIVIANLARRAAVLDPPEEVTLFLETARRLFDSTNVAHMMSTFFTHCKAPNLAPSQGVPAAKEKKNPPCPKDAKDEPQPFDVPDSEKGTPEEHGVLKQPKIVEETDDGDEAVASSDENSEYEDIGIPSLEYH